MLYSNTLLLQCLIAYKHAIFSFANPMTGTAVKIADKDQFPFIVSIGRKLNRLEPYNHRCTGALISMKHVLTSAHCLEGESFGNLQVKVGSVDLRKGKAYDIGFGVTYHEYEWQHLAVSFDNNDIAILELFEEVKEPNVKPATYSKTLQTKDYINKTIEIAGWGQMSGNRHPKMLRTASLRVLTTQECEDGMYKASGKLRTTPDTIFCTGATPPVILGCGDSGGPVILNGTIIGINDSVFPSRRMCPLVKTSMKTNLHRAISFYIPFIEFALDL